jgi:hypothetical protein
MSVVVSFSPLISYRYPRGNYLGINPKKEKSLVLNALTYTESPSYWGTSNVKHYLRELQKAFSEVLITITPTELRNRIFQWVERCDPKLEKFLSFNQRIELEKGKVYQLFEIPNNLLTEIDNTLTKQQELSYDALSAGTWKNPKLVFLAKKGNLVEMWYAINASKLTSKSLNFDKLSEDVQNSLISVLKTTVPDMDELEKIRLEYSVFDRIINIVIFDTTQKKVSIATDQPKFIDPADDEQNTIRPEDRLSPLFEKIINSFGISSQKAKTILERRKIDADSIKKIKMMETKELLLLPFRFDIIYKDGDLTASNRTKFTQLTTGNIFPIVEEYHKTNNTFKDFFSTYSNLDAHKNSALLQKIMNLSAAEDEAKGFFLFIVVNSEIHVARVLCNITTGSLRIYLEKGKGAYEYINAELDKIFS